MRDKTGEGFNGEEGVHKQGGRKIDKGKKAPAKTQAGKWGDTSEREGCSDFRRVKSVTSRGEGGPQGGGQQGVEP